VKEPPSLSDLKIKLVAMEVVTPEAPMGAKTVKTKPQGKLTLFLNSFYGRELVDKRFGNAGGLFCGAVPNGPSLSTLTS